MDKADRVWRGDVAKKLLGITGANTVEEAIPLLIDRRLSIFEHLRPPINLPMVASAFGISSRFNYGPMSNPARLRWEGSKCVIDVNNTNNERRQRFSIAHEIGHKALLDNGIRITKNRGSTFYSAEEREEEEICDAIAAAILGLRPEVIRAHLDMSDFVFKIIDQVANDHGASFEATLRAFLRYCEFHAAGVYCEMQGGLVKGLAREFIVRRAYHSASFQPMITTDYVFSDVTCLQEAMRQQGKVATERGIFIIEGQDRALNLEAKRMTIYVENQPKIGVVFLLSGKS